MNLLKVEEKFIKPKDIIESVKKQDEKLEEAQTKNVKSSIVIRKLPGKKMKIIIGDEKVVKEESLEMNMVEPKKTKVIIRRKKN